MVRNSDTTRLDSTVYNERPLELAQWPHWGQDSLPCLLFPNIISRYGRRHGTGRDATLKPELTGVMGLQGVSI